MVKMKLVEWLPLVLVVVFVGFKVHGSSAAFNPADSYLIACGSTQNVEFQGRTFIPDSGQSSFVLERQENTSSATSNSSVPSPIYQSVRIFHTTASYKFKIQRQGRHWVRLYFYPLPDSDYNLLSASITVVTENFVLLNNFTFKNYSGSYLFKEYVVNVTSDTLILTFIPFHNSVTFVNGIEVVLVPDELISDQALALSTMSPFYGLSDLALETVFRLNMGGPLLTPHDDRLGRTWENDEKYLHEKKLAVNMAVNPVSINYSVNVTPEIAPNWVYATAETMGRANVSYSNINVTWVFPVDPNFMYFIRLHFCDIVSKWLNVLLFNVYINFDSAITGLDLSSLTGGLAVPYYKDFISNSLTNSNTLTVSVGPDRSADYSDAFMNGLEIMKISNNARSLDGLSSVEALLPKSPSKRNNIAMVIGLAVGISAVVGLIALCYCCLVPCRARAIQQGHPWLPLPLWGNFQTRTKVFTTPEKNGTVSCISLTPLKLGRLFMFQEIMDATNNFDENLLLGVGGFGRVYKGTLEDGTQVAVKRGNPRSGQGLTEFQTEIELLSKIHHRHLVSLIGYCYEGSEMILVYEYMANGTLRSHLYGTDLPSLSWRQRLEICIGVARGLHYLHTEAAQSIIHRDVKSANILLNENFVAKVADFGISKIVPALDQTHVSTVVKGTFGYLDPEYFRKQQLTEKSDVYSFGVVLMEVLYRRPALNPVLPTEQANIVDWARSWWKKGMSDHIMDPTLVGKVNAASLKKFRKTAEMCLEDYGIDRPTMGDVLWYLEFALQLDETSSTFTEPEDNITNHIPGIPLAPLEPYDHSMSMIDGVNSGTDDDGEDLPPMLSSLN